MPQVFFARMIAASDRECINGCTIEEGSMYMRAKNEDPYCLDCVAYEESREG